jgi:archaellum biogenesis ATPase FlaH
MVIEQTMTNSDFLAEIYGPLPAGQHGWVCTFRADPGDAPADVWSGRAYKGLPAQAAVIDRADRENTYFCTSVLRATDDGEIVRRKDAYVRLAVLVLDDVQPDDVQGYSYAIQTSPGKFQVGVLLDPDDPDCANRALIDRVMSALAARGRSNDASGNACVRYVRLPVGSNTKPRAAGTWQVQLMAWRPTTRWSLDDACAAVGIELDALRVAAALPKAAPSSTHGTHAGEFVTGLTAPLNERAYHDSLTRMAASLVAGGMYPGAAVEHLYSLMDAVRPTGPEDEVRRWEHRRAEIPRAVRSAEKFAPDNRKPPSITVNLAQQQPPQQPRPGEPEPMDWGRLDGEQPEPTAWRWDGWLPEGTVTLLSANGGVGKSNLALQLSVALVHGHEFMGTPAAPSRVLVLSGEDEARTVHFRVANICRDASVPMHSLHQRMTVYDLTQHDCVLWRDGHPTERLQWLADQAVRTRAEVIVIDNASDVFADNENDRTAVRGFMRALNLIAHHTRAAVLLLAHVDKASVRAGAGLDSNTTFSGSTAWNNSARSRWAMVREEQGVLLRHEKCNLGPLQEEIRMEFDASAKIFRRFGTVPGAAAARALVRSSQRVAVLRLLATAGQRGQRLSMSVKANNNAYVQLRDEPEFPRQLQRPDFFSLLTELQRDGLVQEVEYLNESRKRHKCLELTEVGRMRVAQGSGAAAMWRGGAAE